MFIYAFTKKFQYTTYFQSRHLDGFYKTKKKILRLCEVTECHVM